MSNESTPTYEWSALIDIAKAGQAYEEHEAAERAKIRGRLDQAIERLEALAREFEEIRDDLEVLEASSTVLEASNTEATEQRQTPSA